MYQKIVSSDLLDFMGHVNNVSYLQLLEDARWHLYNSLGYTQKMVLADKIGPIILETNIRYRKEIFFNEMITVKTVCCEYNGLLGKLVQTIYKENGQRSCQAERLFGLFDLSKRKLIPPQGLWKEIHWEMMKRNGDES